MRRATTAGPAVTTAMRAARVARAPKVAAHPATARVATGRLPTDPLVNIRLVIVPPDSARPVTGRVVTARPVTVRREIALLSAIVHPVATGRRVTLALRVVIGRKVIARRVRRVTDRWVTVRRVPTVAREVTARREVIARPAARKVVSGATVVDACKALVPSLLARARVDPAATVAAGLAVSRVVRGRATAPRQRP